METPSKYHTECMDIVRKSLECQEQKSLNKDKPIDCSAIIELYKACKRNEHEKVITERKLRNSG